MNLKCSNVLILATFSVYFNMNSQNQDINHYSISGKVQIENEIPSTAYFVHLFETNTNTLFKTENIEESGNFQFRNIPEGTYSIQITEGITEYYRGPHFDVNQNMEVSEIAISKEPVQLEEVIITKTKPYIERQQGKMILNIENSIGSSGASAFEILEKAPSVTVDNNDNISLRGKSGIIVQIDGKQTPMSGSNLANFLRGIPSENIDKIEFITNPSAKYDAAGSAIINIKLKKDKKIGLNGSITSAYGQGEFPKSNSTLSLNYRNEKVNLFGSYSFLYREWYNKLILDRDFYDNQVFTGSYEQDNFLKLNFRNHIGRIGVDYYINDKHTIGVTVNTLSNKFNPTGDNVSNVFDENNTLASRFNTKNNSRDNWYNYAINLNHKFEIDSLGTEWTTDLDYANFGNKTEQNFTTRYYNLDNEEYLDPYSLYGDINGDLDIYSLKSDFVTTFKNKIKFETGVKTSYVIADNDLEFFDISNETPIFDPTKSNHFIYKENINATYITVSKEFEKWSYNVGLRVENTNISGEQVVDSTSFKNKYTQLFPNAVFSYTLNENNGVELNYSRRISRPSYDQLNPFKFFLDPTTYKEGNPYLKPQITHAIELTHIYKQKIFTTFSFSRTSDNITQVVAPSDDDQQLTIQTDKNLNTVDIIGVFTIIPFDFTKWWNVNNSLNFYYGAYSGTVANTTLQEKGNFTFNGNSTHNFKLGNGYTAEITGNYRAREIYAFMDLDPTWFVNIGFQKKFENNSNIKFTFNDIFWTSNASADIVFTNYREHFDVIRDSRVATLSYTYNFGKGNGQQRKTGGAEDIKQRAGSN